MQPQPIAGLCGATWNIQCLAAQGIPPCMMRALFGQPTFIMHGPGIKDLVCEHGGMVKCARPHLGNYVCHHFGMFVVSPL
mmetsp:Transcript_4240/g.9235  ORF Transcript_4240/g.9235 Transcript_4240/m.9235 type:complete len:80 (-) Transcript_4240:210-449(-)